MKAGEIAATSPGHLYSWIGAASTAQLNPVSPSAATGEVEAEGEEEEEDGEVLKLDEEVEKTSAVEDKRDVRRLADPRKPSREEVEEHDAR